MTVSTGLTFLEQARQVADTILYEGYLLYPYRASAQKNQQRFQFGVLTPPAYVEVDPSERATIHTECVLESPDDAVVQLFVRYLQVQRRSQSGQQSWDEAVDQEHAFTTPLSALLAGEVELPFHREGEHIPEITPGGMVNRDRAALSGVVRASAERIDGRPGAVRLRVTTDNRTDPGHPVATRQDALPYSLVAAHTVIGVAGGAFVSMVDPPDWATAEVAACHNEGTWPVLVGPTECHELVLASPIILYDHPQIAPESIGDLYDSTEIDEILTLRTLVLTDAEKAEARATDPRAAAVIDRVENIQPEVLDRLHGAIRYLRATTTPSATPSPTTEPVDRPDLELPPQFMFGGPDEPGGGAPWWDPGSDTSVSPETDEVVIGGVPVARGSRVVMRPGTRRADAQDLFLIGREAVVEAVLQDVDGNVHLAVTPQDDPAAEFHRWHGRYLYFAPDEVEPIEATP